MKALVKNSFLVLNSLVVSTLLVACAGDSSDPLAKYDNLNGVPPHTEESDKQIADPRNPFIIEIEGGSSNTSALFTEGIEGITEVRVTENNLQGTDYIQLAGAAVVGIPDSEKFTFVNTDKNPNIFTLKWTPSIGFLQGKSSDTFLVTVIAKSKNGKGKETLLPITVNKSGKIPSIIGTSGIDGKVFTEGDSFDFYVDVKDPNIYDVSQPRIIPVEYESTDRAAFRDTVVSKPNPTITVNPESQNGNVFRFYRRIALNDIATFRDRHNKEVPNATSIDVCTLIAVQSVTGTTSGSNQYCFKVNYLAQAATITWASELPKQIPAGLEFKANFKVGTQNGLSKVAINKLSTQIAGLSGTKKLEKVSTDDNDKEVEYALTWTPSCAKANIKKFPLKLKVDSSLNGKSLSTPLDYEIEVVASEENCTVTPKGAK